MLQLQPEQADLLRALEVRRTAGAVAHALAQAFPAVVERLQDRWPAFVDAAVSRAAALGLREPRDLAVYVGVCCVWGVGFEDRAGFEWAGLIARDARRPPTLRLHQLVSHSGHALRPAAGQAKGAGGLGPAEFEAAMSAIESQMVTLGASQAVYIVERPVVKVAACDLAKVEFQSGHPSPPLEYQVTNGAWQRVPAPVLAPVMLRLAEPPEAGSKPRSFVVLSRAAGDAAPVLLNVRAEMLAVCDAKVHPELTHRHGAGQRVWRGRDALKLSLPLMAVEAATAVVAAPPALPVAAHAAPTSAGLPPDPGAPAGIAAAPAPDLQSVEISTCGVRDTGAPCGTLGVALQVYPATQRWFEVRHPPWGSRTWPQPVGQRPAEPPPKTGCRLESDGAPRLPVAWQRQWHGLHTAIDEGLERLFNAWDRAIGGLNPRLEAEVSALAGQASITWGYRQLDASDAAMRTEGRIDMAGCVIDLKLSGEVVHEGARSRVRLSAKGRSDWAMRLAQIASIALPDESLNDAVRTLQLPFVLEVEPLANTELSTLFAADMAEPMFGALVADYGLRPRADGAGFQWFFTLRVDPVTALFEWREPLLGHDLHSRTLLPAMTLVDWSAG